MNKSFYTELAFLMIAILLAGLVNIGTVFLMPTTPDTLINNLFVAGMLSGYTGIVIMYLFDIAKKRKKDGIQKNKK